MIETLTKEREQLPNRNIPPRLILFVDTNGRWSPATLRPAQRSDATLKIRSVRGGKDAIVDRNIIAGFSVKKSIRKLS